MKLNWNRYLATLNSWRMYEKYYSSSTVLGQKINFTRYEKRFRNYCDFGIFYQIYEECNFNDFHKIRNFVRKWNKTHNEFEQIGLWVSKRQNL